MTVLPPAEPPPPGGPIIVDEVASNRDRNLIIAAAVAVAVLLLVVVLVLTGTHGTSNNNSTILTTSSSTPTLLPSQSPLSTVTPSPSASPSATTPVTSTATPPPPSLTIQGSTDPVVVARTLYPDAGSCGAGTTYTSCPVTPDLASALRTWVTTNSLEALCRCVNYQPPTSYTEDKSQLPTGYQGNSSYTSVDVRLLLPAAPPAAQYEHMLVLMVKGPGGIYVAQDTYCVPDDLSGSAYLNRMTSGNAKTCRLYSS